MKHWITYKIRISIAYSCTSNTFRTCEKNLLYTFLGSNFLKISIFAFIYKDLEEPFLNLPAFFLLFIDFGYKLHSPPRRTFAVGRMFLIFFIFISSPILYIILTYIIYNYKIVVLFLTMSNKKRPFLESFLLLLIQLFCFFFIFFCITT